MEIGVSTLGKIELNKSPEEGYNLTKAVLDTLGLKIKEKDDEKFFLKSKTKMSWIQNRFGIDFRILVRPAGSFCVIEIYSNRNSHKTNLIDKDEYFLLYEIKKVKKVLPTINDVDFLDNVKNEMKINEMKKLHKELLEKIQNKKMNDVNFIEISKNKNLIKEAMINSVNDDSLFEPRSIDLIYSLPINSYALVGDKEKNISIVKILDFVSDKFIKNDGEKSTYKELSNNTISTELYGTFDLYLNKKYKVELNEKSMERIKNYFK